MTQEGFQHRLVFGIPDFFGEERGDFCGKAPDSCPGGGSTLPELLLQAVGKEGNPDYVVPDGAEDIFLASLTKMSSPLKKERRNSHRGHIPVYICQEKQLEG